MAKHTSWKCEKCGAAGVVDAADDDSVYSVVETLRASHRAASEHGQGSPACEWDLAFVRVSDTSESGDPREAS